MTKGLDVRIEWLDAPSVTTPELAATWARYEIWVGGECATQVEASDGTFRRSVYGSLYPLAEWIAGNWFSLNYHIRPSAIDTRYWTWANLRSHRWLRQHNLRAAGDGMPWPDLTIVAEGPVARLTWRPDRARRLRPIRFAANGAAWVRTADALESLAEVVNHVLERLAESGLPKTRLVEEWVAISVLDPEEQEFSATVAQLGLDPFSVTDATAEDVMRIAEQLPPDLAKDFFDSADATALVQAAEWTQRAVIAADEATAQARESLAVLYDATSQSDPNLGLSAERPWLVGYSMARAVRQELGLGITDRFDTSPWVGIHDVGAPSGGIQEVVSIRSQRCGLALGGSPAGSQTGRFRQAQAMGRALARPDDKTFLMSPGHGHDERIARAFAAELLAPAEGINRLLQNVDSDTDAALESVALEFNVSPLVVRHQFDNQLASTFD